MSVTIVSFSCDGNSKKERRLISDLYPRWLCSCGKEVTSISEKASAVTRVYFKDPNSELLVISTKQH